MGITRKTKQALKHKLYIVAISWHPFSSQFTCDFYLNWFPFDSQYCTLDLVAPDNQKNLVELQPTNIFYFGPESLDKSKIFSIRICQHEFNGDQGIR